MGEKKLPQRVVEKEIEIDASLDAVWKALTEAEELKRWFPLDAKVTPGAGGKVWMAWGDFSGESPIEVWEPRRHLRTVESHPPSAMDIAAGADPNVPLRMALDYYLETRRGKTVLRLVHSGFSAAADWNDEYDTVNSGWASFLRNLRFYLERHAGTPRVMVWSRRATELAPAEAWKRLTGPDGLRLETDGEGEAGSPYRMTLGKDAKIKGTIEVFRSPVHFAGTDETPDQSFLFLEMEPAGRGCRPAVWLSTYGMDPARREQLQQETHQTMNQLFGTLEKLPKV